MNAQAAKIAPGKWIVHKPKSGGIFVETEMPVAAVCFYYADAAEANAALIAEAGTVANKTGLWPQQLADQRAELLRELQNAVIQMEMAAKCLEEGRKDEALLHVSSLMRPKKAAIQRATGEQP